MKFYLELESTVSPRIEENKEILLGATEIENFHSLYGWIDIDNIYEKYTLPSKYEARIELPYSIIIGLKKFANSPTLKVKIDTTLDMFFIKKYEKPTVNNPLYRIEVTLDSNRIMFLWVKQGYPDIIEAILQ